ncbi:MAG: hypothetical protein IJR86_02760 [Bacteroidaceae bacterium]|nr:hypothetical protein [Bacteroidaceae bacterium]
MYKIQANASGTRSIEVTEEHLLTIEKYSLFKGLVPSNGIVDETTLESLKHNVKSFILNNDECADLADLCTNVIYHDNMKVFGLKELIMLYVGWRDAREEELAETEQMGIEEK